MVEEVRRVREEGEKKVGSEVEKERRKREREEGKEREWSKRWRW